jgi:uncharacterized protein (TIGR03435 family)
VERRIFLAGAAAAVSAARAADLAPAFEVASIRKSAPLIPPRGAGPDAPPPPPPPPGHRTSPTSLILERVTLKYCLQWTTGVRGTMISGPDWIHFENYDISARTASPVAVEMLKPMLLHLLTERFQLGMRREAKEVRVTGLVLGAGGLKLRPSAPGAESSREFTPAPNAAMRLVAVGTGLDFLEGLLSFPMWDPVVNLTGLDGKYDFTYERPPMDPLNRDGWLSDIRVSLEKQLGLTVAGRKAPVETIVIDRAERNPIENE